MSPAAPPPRPAACAPPASATHSSSQRLEPRLRSRRLVTGLAGRSPAIVGFLCSLNPAMRDESDASAEQLAGAAGTFWRRPGGALGAVAFRPHAPGGGEAGVVGRAAHSWI